MDNHNDVSAHFIIDDETFEAFLLAVDDYDTKAEVLKEALIEFLANKGYMEAWR